MSSPPVTCSRPLSEYYDKKASKFGKDVRACNYHSKWSFVQRQRVVMQLLATLKGKGILDVGCGSGLFTAPLARANDLVGVDVSENMLHLAAGTLKPILAEGERLPFKNESFDVVLAIETLQHIDAPEVFLKELARVTRIGGQLILSTLHGGSFLQKIFRRLGVQSDLYTFHPLEEICSRFRGDEWVRLDTRFLGFPLPWTWSSRGDSHFFSFLATAWIVRLLKKPSRGAISA